MKLLIIDGLVKSLKNRILVIPVKTGIQCFLIVKIKMDSRFRGNDNFLRVHQLFNNKGEKFKMRLDRAEPGAIYMLPFSLKYHQQIIGNC